MKYRTLRSQMINNTNCCFNTL